MQGASHTFVQEEAQSRVHRQREDGRPQNRVYITKSLQRRFQRIHVANVSTGKGEKMQQSQDDGPRGAEPRIRVSHCRFFYRAQRRSVAELENWIIWDSGMDARAGAGGDVVRTYEEETRFVRRVAPTQFEIDVGFVPNMRVPGTFYVNDKLEELMFEELEHHTRSRGVGGFLPAMKQIANVAGLPGIVKVRKRRKHL